MKRKLAGLLLAALLGWATAHAQEPGGSPAARAALEATKRQALSDLIQQQLQGAQASLEEKTRARNPTGMATYSEAVTLLEGALKEVQANGDFEVPKTWRRVLEPMITALKDGRQEQLDVFTKALADLDALYPPDQRTPPPEAEKPAEATVAPPSTATTPATNLTDALAPADQAPVLNLTMKEAPPPSSDPDVFAQRGGATVWRTIGRWTASMQSEAFITLSCFNQQGDATGAYTNPATRAVSTWRYSPVEVVPPSPAPLRLRRLDKHSVVDVDAWPGQGSSGQDLVFRTRRGRWPVLHGFQLETAGESGPTPDQMVQFPISTDPAGARVLVNGAEYRIGGIPARTPCKITLPPGVIPEIRLRLAGSKDAVASNFRVVPGARIHWRFDRPPAKPSIMVQVDPAKEWAPTRIVLKPDQRARFVVEGSWQVGAKRESCTYQGYPNQPAFAHYYKDGIAPAAKDPSAPYGALLYRIGEQGRAYPVRPDEMAETLVGGMLSFDVNELPGREHRGDNRSMLTVRVTVEGQ